MHLPYIKSVRDVDLKNKRVLIRADLNVPVSDGLVTSDARIQASLATIKAVMDEGASVVVMSHLGRPSEGEYAQEFSLLPVARRLSQLLELSVPLLAQPEDCSSIGFGELGLLENVRFLAGEKSNSTELSKRLADQCDVFVMDAFGTAHRAHASTHGVAELAPVACSGLLLDAELNAFQSTLSAPAKPMVAIIGGAKVSTKLEVLGSLANIAGRIIVGGGIANTFIAAAGYDIGKSLYEEDLLGVAKDIASRVEIPIPVDVTVGKAFDVATPAIVKAIDNVAADEMIMDIGPVTARSWAETLMDAQTIMWNGPLGVFEFDQFGEGTRVLAQAIADSAAFSIAGGGDTLAAVEKYAVAEGISYISTGGGAFLELVEGKVLPAVEVLGRRSA
ncbi:MAG: phosphoglycerate kinase [Pseudomonadales bacterium]|jgi:phosphoglycerate kinase|nr:phosphoglycerate kinase [Pseudomonadales bacterium]